MSESPAVPARPVRVASLRLWLPLVLIAVCLATFLILLAVEQQNTTRDLRQFADRTAHDELLRVKRGVETVLRRADGSGADGLVSELGLDPAVRHAVLVDETGVVLAATRFAWKGRIAAGLVPDYPAAAAEAVREAQRAQLDLSVAALRLTALAPVTLALRPGELRSHRSGILLIEYDLTPMAARAWTHLRQQALVFGGVVLLAALALLWAAQRRIVRPVAALRAGMARIGTGDFSALPRIEGGGEFKDLGDALVRMAQALQGGMAALAESEARFRQLSDAAFEAIVLHEGGRIVDANAAAERLFGVPPGGLSGRDIFALVAPESRESSRLRAARGVEGVWEIDFIDGAGTPIPAEVSVRERRIGERVLRVVAVRDIRPRLAAEAEIRQLAYFDALTGLPNRRLLLERVAGELAEVDRYPRRAALVALNLDGFMAINDSLGMAAGDAVLRAIARRLQPLLAQGDTLARVDGDTFALLIAGLGGDLETASMQAARAAERLLAEIAEPVTVDGHALHLTAGAGLVMIPNDSRDPPELLREAETAMHQAKLAGDSRVRFFAHELQEAASERLVLRNDLKRALAGAGELLLHYQPQVDAGGRLLGVEALVRWQHPARGMVPPGAFIAEAEASGLIVPLGNWVLAEAAACLRRWQTLAAEAPWAAGLSMAVNVSPRQFREPDFVARVEEVLGRVGIEALSLELELTESVVADDLDATLEKMELLRRRGVRFALDDFGTGYSSLAYLKRLPIDTLKIDRSFVMDIDAPGEAGAGKRPAVLIEAIVAMAHQLGLRVLAEGVETETQLARLAHCGCDIFQGYHFSRPLPEAALRAWAAGNTPPAS